MFKRILFGGVFFFFVLILLWEIMLHSDVQSVAQLLRWDTIKSGLAGTIGATSAEMTRYEMGIFFTTFVMMQFWNIFNAKNYRTEGSFFLTMFTKNSFSGAFYLIVLVILGGQYLIVNCLGNFFDVAPLTAGDWWRIIAVTSLVLVVPEIKRIIKTIFVKK